jgi:hypothetical protein
MTGLDLAARTLKRLDQDPAGPVYFSQQEILNALDKGQRLFALATLCLENIVTFPLTSGTAFYSMLPTYPNWLLPLRAANGAGQKVNFSTLEELHALDDAWRSNTGSASHYGCLGFDLLFVRGTGDALTICYAREPDALGDGTAEVEIVEDYQPCLIDYAIARARAKQGGQEFSKALPYFERFLGSMKAAADDTKRRSAGAGNDRQPFEFAGFTPAKLLAAELRK